MDSHDNQGEALILRVNAKAFNSLLEVQSVCFPLTAGVSVLLYKFGHWSIWSSVVAFLVLNITLSVTSLTVKTVSIEVQRGDILRFITQVVIFGRTQTRIKEIGPDWAWIAVKTTYEMKTARMSYTIELGNRQNHVDEIISIVRSNPDSLALATKICSDIARFLGLQDRGFVGNPSLGS